MFYIYYKDSEGPVKLDNDIAKQARIFNKDMKRPVKPYEEAVNTAAPQLAKNNPTHSWPKEVPYAKTLL